MLSSRNHRYVFALVVVACNTICSANRPPHVAVDKKLNQTEFYAHPHHQCPPPFQSDCYLHAVLNIIGVVGSTVDRPLYIVNIGANDGKTMDPLYEYFAAGASGLLVELDDANFALLNANVPWNDRVVKVQEAVTPANIGRLFESHNVPHAPDVVKIDIDSYDIVVVDSLLSTTAVRPKVIVMEINEKIPPPISFTINYYQPYSYKGDHCYGVSIEKAVSVGRSHGYDAVALDWNNLILVDGRDHWFRFKALDKSATSLYHAGYWDRDARSTKFPWNANVDHWVAQARSDVDGTMREIFDFMVQTRSFQSKSSMTFEVGVATNNKEGRVRHVATRMRSGWRQ